MSRIARIRTVRDPDVVLAGVVFVLI